MTTIMQEIIKTLLSFAFGNQMWPNCAKLSEKIRVEMKYIFLTAQAQAETSGSLESLRGSLVNSKLNYVDISLDN